jgi:Ran GTPase-activating protein (RanGAP) involved in mRNA processing and transport
MIETAKSNNRINQLFLKNCRINNKLLGRIGQAVMKNDTLRLLDLSDNYFDHEGLSSFMPCLYDNNVLGSLVLDGNALRGEGFKSIRKARFLKRLNLEQCDLENEEIEHVCWLISEYSQLNYLDLSYNKVNLAST